MSLELKNKVVEKCFQVLEDKIAIAQKAIDDSSASNNSENKSSAGDKHNTSQAMLHLEQEKNAKNFEQLQKQYQFLKSIDFKSKGDSIALGKLVVTKSQTFLLAISLGKLKVDHQEVFCISTAAPLGQKLLQKKVYETVDFRGQSFKILGVY
tara:strand:+ start:46 stop:501 length:456 start_codon:yes stop_codon:yes gene_type:complete